jgi:Bacteriophage replication protein O
MKKAAQQIWRFKGFISPRYTQVPDALFDELMAYLSGAELKVLLYIIRRTFGFKKDSDTISLSQMCHGIKTREGEVLDKGTGLSLSTVQIALKGLLEKNCVITARNRSQEKGDEPTTYSLHMLPDTENRQEGVPKIGKGSYRKSVTQETDRQETVDNTVNGVVKGEEGSSIRKLQDLDQPKEKTAYVAQFLLDELGDQQSEKFYRLVAAKIPEAVIREALSAIRVDGAEHPAKLFTYKMQRYALGRRGVDSRTKTFGVSRKRGKVTTYTSPAMIRNNPEQRDLRK